MPKKIVVAIINIGDSYSSCAISLKHDMVPRGLVFDPMKINIPNTILFNAKQEFKAFGYDAENRYLDAHREGDANKWLYFRRFTDGNNINSSNIEILVETFDKKFQMPLINILSAAIRYFKHKILHSLMSRQTGVQKEDLFWILVTSDYLHNSARHLLVESCKNCGFEDDQIQIESESKAISISCRQYLGSKPGRSYIMVDSGLKETFKGVTSDLPLISVSIFEDTALFWHLQQWLLRIVGIENGQNLTSNVEDFADLFREFDLRFRNKVDLDKKIAFKVPLSLMACIQNTSETSEEVRDLQVIGDKIRVKSTVLLEAMQQSSESFLSDLAYLIKENRTKGECKDILIVGELSEIKMFKVIIRRKFPDISIAFLEEHVSVIHGASVIGHSPQLFLTSECNCQNLTHQMETAHIRLHDKCYKLYIQKRFSVKSNKSRHNEESPNEITTLPDPHRPVRIAERFSELFHVDRPKCIEQLEIKGIHIEMCIEILFNIVTASFVHCKNYFQSQSEQLVRLLNPLLTDTDIEKWKKGQLLTSVQPDRIIFPIATTRRKTISDHTPIILKSLQNEIATKFQLNEEQIVECRKFALKCVENSYYMQTMAEPMHMFWDFQDGDFIDWSVLEVFGKHGVLIDRLVWPVIYLHKNGALVNKGIVHAK